MFSDQACLQRGQLTEVREQPSFERAIRGVFVLPDEEEEDEDELLELVSRGQILKGLHQSNTLEESLSECTVGADLV